MYMLLLLAGGGGGGGRWLTAWGEGERGATPFVIVDEELVE